MDDETRAYIANRYEIFNSKQLDMISYEAYDRGHSAGQDEVNGYAKDIADFTYNLIMAK